MKCIFNSFLLSCFLLAGCLNHSRELVPDEKLAPPRDTVKIFSDTPDTFTFRKQFTPGASRCDVMVRDRALIALLVYKKCIVTSITGSDRNLQSGNKRFWVCNLPDTICIPGDTVLASGKVYNIFGDEKTYGNPVVLDRIFLKQNK